MARPHKPRQVCARPGCTRFGPHGGQGTGISMTVDEYEVIRLIDLEELTQEECAAQMGVARTTVQAIYAAARKKLAACIVQGRQLIIGGGDVHYCEHRGRACGRGCCRQRGCGPQTGKDEAKDE